MSHPSNFVVRFVGGISLLKMSIRGSEGVEMAVEGTTTESEGEPQAPWCSREASVKEEGKRSVKVCVWHLRKSNRDLWKECSSTFLLPSCRFLGFFCL